MSAGTNKSSQDTSSQGSATSQYDPDRYQMQQDIAHEMYGDPAHGGVTGFQADDSPQTTYYVRPNRSQQGPPGPGSGGVNPNDPNSFNNVNPYNGGINGNGPNGVHGNGQSGLGAHASTVDYTGTGITPYDPNASTSTGTSRGLMGGDHSATINGATTTGNITQGDPTQGQGIQGHTGATMNGYSGSAADIQAIQAQQAQRAYDVQAAQAAAQAANQNGLGGFSTMSRPADVTPPGGGVDGGGGIPGNGGGGGGGGNGGGGGTLPPWVSGSGNAPHAPFGFSTPTATTTAAPYIPSAETNPDGTAINSPTPQPPASNGGGPPGSSPALPVPYSLSEAGPQNGIDANGNPTYGAATNVWNAGGASGNRQLSGGQAFSGYSGMANNGGYDDATKNAIAQEGMNAARSQYSGAANSIGMNAAATGNTAGMAAAMSQLGRDEGNTLGQQSRQNQINFAQEKQRQKEAGLSGLSNLNQSESSYLSSLFGQRAGLSNQPLNKTNQTTGTGNTVGGNFGISI